VYDSIVKRLFLKDPAIIGLSFCKIDVSILPTELQVIQNYICIKTNKQRNNSIVQTVIMD